MVFRPKKVDQSDSDYTFVYFLYGMHGSSAYPVDTLGSFPEGSLLDFRVRAEIGYLYRLNEYSDDWFFVGEVSEYANQTITIPTFDEPSTTTPLASPTSNTSSSSKPSTSNSGNSSQQKQPQQYHQIIILVFVCIITILLVVIVYQHKQRKTKSPPTQT